MISVRSDVLLYVYISFPSFFFSVGPPTWNEMRGGKDGGGGGVFKIHRDLFGKSKPENFRYEKHMWMPPGGPVLSFFFPLLGYLICFALCVWGR